MKHIVVASAIALAASSAVPLALRAAAAPRAVPAPQEPSAPTAGTAPASAGLSDLNAMTFGCPKAALNAAAREARSSRSAHSATMRMTASCPTISSARWAPDS